MDPYSENRLSPAGRSSLKLLPNLPLRPHFVSVYTPFVQLASLHLSRLVFPTFGDLIRLLLCFPVLRILECTGVSYSRPWENVLSGPAGLRGSRKRLAHLEELRVKLVVHADSGFRPVTVGSGIFLSLLDICFLLGKLNPRAFSCLEIPFDIVCHSSSAFIACFYVPPKLTCFSCADSAHLPTFTDMLAGVKNLRQLTIQYLRFSHRISLEILTTLVRAAQIRTLVISPLTGLTLPKAKSDPLSDARMQVDFGDFVEAVGKAVSRGRLRTSSGSDEFSLHIGVAVPSDGAAVPSTMRSRLHSRLTAAVGVNVREVSVEFCERLLSATWRHGVLILL